MGSAKMNKSYNFVSGNSPLLISMPHVGISIPDHIASNMTPQALQRADTDWHLVALYDMAEDFDASVLSAEYMRYVIDLNRSTDNASLYPGQDTTALCPLDTFDKQAIYQHGKVPDAAEIALRIEQYWQPYHQKLASELQRLQSLHGIALLWDAHSIASSVPRFFSGKLPDLNFGTANVQSCDASLQATIAGTLAQSVTAQQYSQVFNGRFKGGYITRHYGVPAINVHALQLEMSQCIYMQEQAPYAYNPELAAQVKPLLAELLASCIHWANSRKLS
jgi:N-formylglutamate deformylase